MIRKVYTTTEEFTQQNRGLECELPFSENLEVLKNEIKINDKSIKNRLACQAMEGCDGNADGTPGELTLRRYDRFAKGGAGLIWYEATAVLPEGKANPRQLYINENNLDTFKRQVERIKETAIKENGIEPVVIMQATHSGRYSKPEGVPAPLIAYNNPIFEKDSPISSERIVTDEYIDRVKEALINASSLAEKSGFDGVDIKACHRYLNCELLSAYKREGRYGGDFYNRTRLLRESILGAMEITGKNFIVTSRMNVYDGFPYPYGFGVNEGSGIDIDLSEPVELIKILSSYGVKLLNITMGNPYFNPHVNRPFAKGGYTHEEHPLEGVTRMLRGISEIKREVPEMKIISSAMSYLGIAAPFVAAGFIEQGGFDIAGFGRTVFAYPDFANDILKKGGMDKNKICICCSKCTEIMRTPGGTPGCVIRDKDVYAPIYKKQCGGTENG
ncbi:MAG: flavin oxidoreductase/NADH oxidase [Ruminococcaceae bacterium]|nr:flavin oxidoreductase/NADH oxidase [Oscillospiraceae bacterium]